MRSAKPTCLVIGLLFQLGGCHGAGRGIDSDLPGADIRVDGIDCPYCVYNISGALTASAPCRSINGLVADALPSIQAAP